MDIEIFLNERLKKLELVREDALANKNYTLALNTHIRIDEIKELIYLLTTNMNISADANKQEA